MEQKQVKDNCILDLRLLFPSLYASYNYHDKRHRLYLDIFATTIKYYISLIPAPPNNYASQEERNFVDDIVICNSKKYQYMSIIKIELLTKTLSAINDDVS